MDRAEVRILRQQDSTIAHRPLEDNSIVNGSEPDIRDVSGIVAGRTEVTRDSPRD